MRLVNAGFATESRFFWDERSATLEAQTTQPVRDHTEMGFSGTSGDPAFSDLVTRLTAIPEYRVLFAMTYGSATITETRIQNALAQFACKCALGFFLRVEQHVARHLLSDG